jgi:hypothetical protein
MEDPLAPSLVHIATRLSGHKLGDFLQCCPNIQVLELAGGDLFEYWCKNTKKDASNATRDGFDGQQIFKGAVFILIYSYTDSTMSPLTVLLYRNENLPNTLRKLNIIAHSYDIWRITEFFEVRWAFRLICHMH